MAKTVTPIEAEIARLAALVDEQSAEYQTGESDIRRAATERNALHEAQSDKNRPSLGPDEYGAKVEALDLMIMAGNRRTSAAQRLLEDAKPNLRRARDLATQIERAQPVDELARTLAEACATVAMIEGTIAAVRERRLAAISMQAAGDLNDANQRLRELPAELAFAQQAVIEAEINLHDGQACALAADLWAADQTVKDAVETARLADERRVLAVNTSRALHEQHRRLTERADRLRTELARQVAALTAA